MLTYLYEWKLSYIYCQGHVVVVSSSSWQSVHEQRGLSMCRSSAAAQLLMITTHTVVSEQQWLKLSPVWTNWQWVIYTDWNWSDLIWSYHQLNWIMTVYLLNWSHCFGHPSRTWLCAKWNMDCNVRCLVRLAGSDYSSQCTYCMCCEVRLLGLDTVCIHVFPKHVLVAERVISHLSKYFQEIEGLVYLLQPPYFNFIFYQSVFVIKILIHCFKFKKKLLLKNNCSSFHCA